MDQSPRQFGFLKFHWSESSPLWMLNDSISVYIDLLVKGHHSDAMERRFSFYLPSSEPFADSSLVLPLLPHAGWVRLSSPPRIRKYFIQFRRLNITDSLILIYHFAALLITTDLVMHNFCKQFECSLNCNTLKQPLRRSHEWTWHLSGDVEFKLN